MVSLVTDKAKLEGNTLSILLPEGARAGVEKLLSKKQGWAHSHLGTPQRSVLQGRGARTTSFMEAVR